MSQSNQPLDQFSRQKAAAKTAYLKMQSDICAALENADGKANFSTDAWKRIDPTIEDAGGGISRIITDGAIFEKGGVNFSEVYGTLPREMSKTLVDQDEPLPFYAVGTSLVIHPLSPQVPTIHANFRLITTADRCWVGGGIDLTPYVYNEEVFHFFHSELKKQCDQFDPEYYPAYKKHCDKYFFIPHRHETRGIGGIFFDYLGREDQNALPSAMEFAFGMAAQFNDLYLPIVEQTRNLEATASTQKISAHSQRTVRRIQPRARSRHPIRFKNRRPHRIYTDVPSSSRELGIRLQTRGRRG